MLFWGFLLLANHLKNPIEGCMTNECITDWLTNCLAVWLTAFSPIFFFVLHLLLLHLLHRIYVVVNKKRSTFALRVTFQNGSERTMYLVMNRSRELAGYEASVPGPGVGRGIWKKRQSLIAEVSQCIQLEKQKKSEFHEHVSVFECWQCRCHSFQLVSLAVCRSFAVHLV